MRYIVCLLASCVFGYIVRFAVLGLPRVVSKYGGSALWAMAIFWLVSASVPQKPLALRAGVSVLLAFGIEFFKLVREPALDRLRLTLSGKLILGRIFSTRDLLAYLAAILLAVALDRILFRRSRALAVR